MPYAITNKEANGNEFFALLRIVSPDLLVFKVVDVTGDEYDYSVSVNSYVDEKVIPNKTKEYLRIIYEG